MCNNLRTRLRWTRTINMANVAVVAPSAMIANQNALAPAPRLNRAANVRNALLAEVMRSPSAARHCDCMPCAMVVCAAAS